MKKFVVIIPSLQRLSLYIPYDVDEFVIEFCITADNSEVISFHLSSASLKSQL